MKKFLVAILVLQIFTLNCNPALVTKIFPSPLPNLNRSIEKQIGLYEISATSPEISSESRDMLRSSLAAAFSDKQFFVYNVNSFSDENWKNSSIIIKSHLEEITSVNPDPIDWLPIGIGFVIFIVPGVAGYYIDKNTERRETKISVTVSMIDSKMNQELWSNTIDAERGDDAGVSAEEAINKLYADIADQVVRAVESRW